MSVICLCNVAALAGGRQMAESKCVNFVLLCYHQGFIIFQGSAGVYKSKLQWKVVSRLKLIRCNL